MKIFNVLSAIAVSCLLFGCGGGGGDANAKNNTNSGTAHPQKSDGSYSFEKIPYNYSEIDQADIYETVNSYRTTCGFSSIKQNSMLDISAIGHAKYLQTNSTSGHIQLDTNLNFTGTNLLNRTNAAGYQASKLGEIAGTRNSGSLFAGTSSSGVETSANVPTGKAMVNSLFSSVYHLSAATSEWSEMGIGFSASGNLTPLPGETMFYAATVLNFGVPAGNTAPVYTGGEIRSFPCNGISGISPIFTAELPNPYPSRNFDSSPMGTPVLLTSANGGPIVINAADMINAGTGTEIITKVLNASDDVNKLIAVNQALVIPDQPLAVNTAYKVTIKGISDGDFFVKEINFMTGGQN